jgi:2-phosphoglycerate kinase
MARLVLVFGTSHVGKSTLAQRLGERLGWPVNSTDKKGRHPGRPWPEVKEPVAEHYARLSDETIHWFVRVHQENIWPYIRHLICEAISQGGKSIFEGSALRPEFIATLNQGELVPIGFHASEAFLRDRMLTQSDYHRRDAVQRVLIDKFIERSLRQNADFIETAGRLGLPMLDAQDQEAIDSFVERCVAELQAGA